MPTYRYRCQDCGEIEEIFVQRHSLLVPPKVCGKILEYTSDGEFEIICGGEMKKLFDTFQFHISGR